MIGTLQEKKIVCYHCGDTCRGPVIYSQEKSFCCAGCKSVYEILQENSLCDYYSLDEKAGNKISEVRTDAYAFLREESIKSILLNFQEGNKAGITFHIPSVHCSSCIWLLENLQKIHPAVFYSSIHFQKKELEVQFDSSLLSLEELALLLVHLGYPPEISLNGKSVTNQSANKALLYKIGVAGFCFGNIMLLSIPEYVSFLDDFKGPIKHFFAYLSLLLSLPVFFYSASDYFRSAWNAVKTRIINIDFPIAMALAAAFVQSAFEIFTGSGMGYLDSLTGLVFFLLIGKWYQQKTYGALSFDRDYKSYFPLAATLLKEEKESYVPLQDLQPGNLILIRHQEIIPADAVLRQGEAAIDYSFVTGESVPVIKKNGERIFAGGRQTGASIKVEVTKKVSESYLTQLWNKDRNAKSSAPGLEAFTNKVGRYFTIAILITSFLTYGYWQWQNPSVALHAMISVLIIFCPCTLALAIPFCFGRATNILAKNGFYLKNTETIERLADSRNIVFDKTGTITRASEAEIEWVGTLNDQEISYVKSLVSHSGHPLSRMLNQSFQNINELPVTSFREILSQGISGVVNQHAVLIGSAGFAGATVTQETLNETRVYVSIDQQLRGFFVFKNKYRVGVKGLLRRLIRRGYSLHLLSGDHEGERPVLKPYFPEHQLHFRQSPSDKLNYVHSLEKTQRTIMIGDGLNDAGALSESHCGICVSEAGANFSPACDAIIEADKVVSLFSFLSYARACVKTVRVSLLVSLFYNLIGLFFACQGVLQPLVAAILMPLSSVSIVLFVTLMSRYLAKRNHLVL